MSKNFNTKNFGPKMPLLVITLFLTITSLTEFVSAHCPLCTAGAGAAAVGASWLGVSNIIIGLFIGAFAVSMGLWFARIIPKQYFPFQKSLIVLASFIFTIFPILYLISMTYPLQISLFGNYGSLFNRIYMVDLSLIGSIFGGLIVMASPSISKRVSKLSKGRIIPFQGVAITILSLIIAGVLIQILL
ncbi:MAG: hypothetical protein WDZ69_00760 [Candidatus Pacearchaeota archaeon]